MGGLRALFARSCAMIMLASGSIISVLSIGTAFADGDIGASGVAEIAIKGWIAAPHDIQLIWGLAVFVCGLFAVLYTTGLADRIRARWTGHVYGLQNIIHKEVRAMEERLDGRLASLGEKFDAGRDALADRVARIEGACRATHGHDVLER